SDGNASVFVPSGVLESPQGITIDIGKSIYIADAHDGSAGAGEIVIFDLTGTKTGTFRSGLDNPAGIDTEISNLIAAEGGAQDRVLQIPLNGNSPSILASGVNDPMGVASQAAMQMGFFRYVCFGTTVRRVDPDLTFTDIPLTAGARGVS